MATASRSRYGRACASRRKSSLTASAHSDRSDLIREAHTDHGRDALRNNTTGDENTAIGYASLDNNFTGSRNIAVGRFAGSNQRRMEELEEELNKVKLIMPTESPR
jgi:hypothetical protein